MKKVFSLFTLLSIGLSCLFAQKVPESKPIKTSKEIIKDAVALLEKKDTLAYLNKLSEVNYGDTLATNVYLSLVSDASRYNHFDLSLKYTDYFISNFPNDDKLYRFVQNKCYVLVEQKKFEEAIKYIDTYALIKFPNYTPFQFFKVKALNELGRLKESQELEYDLIQSNPYYYYTHYTLATKYIKSDYVSQAALGFLTAALVNPNSDQALFYLQRLNNVMTNKQDDVVAANLADTDKFEKLDVLLKNKLALDKNYKVPSKITDGFIKQTHLLLTELVKMDPNDFEGEAFKQFYIPFYKKLMKDGMFENMTYFLFSNEKAFPSIAPKYKKQNAVFTKWLVKTISEICSEDLKSSGMRRSYTTNINSGLSYVAKYKEDVIVGKFTYYRENGNPSLEGEMTIAQEMTGTWKWYYSTGLLAKTVDYKNSLYNGKLVTWSYFSPKTAERDYESGKIVGLEKEFYSEDYPKMSAEYKNNVPNGKVLRYYSNGQMSASFELKEGKLVGQFITFHENGDTNSVEYYNKENVLDGDSYSYYANQIPKFKGKYKNGKRSGTFTWYYKNGNVRETLLYTDNGIAKEKNEYYVNGKKETYTTYNSSGDIEGANKYYDKNGILIHTIYYKSGKITHFENYDKTGKITVTNKKEGSDVNFEFYDAFGVKMSDGKYNRKDGKEGVWNFYYSDSQIKRTINYLDGKTNGLAVSYYEDGVVSSIDNYKNDELDGYYAAYHEDGALKEEGWFENGERVGNQYFYFEDGKTISETSFYVNGNLNGSNDEYYFNGQIKSSSFYAFDKLYRIVRFNLDGKVIDEQDFNSSTYDIKYHFPNGKVSFVSNVVNEDVTGKKIQYFPNGNLDYEHNYICDTYHGIQKSYHSNGKLYYQNNYMMGERIGESKGYYDSGKLSWVYEYQNGYKTAEKSYYENGNTKTIYSFDFGDLNGKVLYYSADGYLDHIRYYDHNKIIGYSYLSTTKDTLPMIPIKLETGDVKNYFPNGKVSREFTLKNGTFEGAYKRYYSTGQLSYQANYEHDESHGESLTYDEKGNLTEKENYYYGKLDGEQKYYKNGKLTSVLNYKFGLLHGSSKFYENGILVNEYLYDTDELIKIIK